MSWTTEDREKFLDRYMLEVLAGASDTVWLVNRITLGCFTCRAPQRLPIWHNYAYFLSHEEALDWVTKQRRARR
jgi:hypothetical protein